MSQGQLDLEKGSKQTLKPGDLIAHVEMIIFDATQNL